MAKVTTQIISGSTVGDGADSVQSQKLTLQNTSKVVSVTAFITAKPSKEGAMGRIFVVSSPVSISAAAAVSQLRRQAYTKEFFWPRGDQMEAHVQSAVRIIQGDYLYVWFELPKVETPGTMDCYATEI